MKEVPEDASNEKLSKIERIVNRNKKNSVPESNEKPSEPDIRVVVEMPFQIKIRADEEKENQVNKSNEEPPEPNIRSIDEMPPKIDIEKE